MAIAERPWVVVRVRPQQLVRATENIANQGAECYSPRALIRSPRTHVLRPEPLFPGYAFARHPEGRWVFLKGTFGVLDVLMRTGEEPAWLSHAEIVRLRAREGFDGMVRLEAREFARGERVCVEHGSFSLLGVVDGMSSRDRVFVLLEMLGRQTRTEVAVRDITRE